MARQFPHALFNVNNSPIKSGSHLFAIRWRARKTFTLHRFFMGFNIEGISPNVCGGRSGYGAGSYGGTIRFRMCSIDGSGFPSLGSPLAEESVQARTRFDQSKALAGVSCTQHYFFNTGGISITNDTEYACVVTNSDASPTSEWFSVNNPVCHRSTAGPHDTNTRDNSTAGAICGLQPTECCMWSTDGGSTWEVGHLVGKPPASGSWPGYYYFTSGDDACKMPWYGWTEAAGDNAARIAGQPYTSYPSNSARHKLEAYNSKINTTLTKAGGYARVGQSIGIVHVKNTTTTDEGTTAFLGSGKQSGTLTPNVAVSVGDDIEIWQDSSTAQSMRAQGDTFLVNLWQIGDLNGDYPFRTKRWGGASFSIDEGRDAACLWVEPWCWFPIAAVDPGGSVEGSFTDELISNASLQSFWPLAETAGTTAEDVEGAIDGTYVNTPTLAQAGLVPADAGATSVRFTSSSSESITFGDNYDFPATDNFTVGAWVKINTLDATSRRIFDKLPGAATDGWQLIVNSTQGWRFFRVIASSFQGVGSGASIPSTGTTYFVVVTYDGTNLKLYINGSLADTGASAGSMAGNTGALRIGAKSDSTSTGPFDGWIQYPFICNDDLTAGAISDLYTAGTVSGDSTAPTMMSSTNVDGLILIVNWSEDLDANFAPVASEFVVKRGGNSVGALDYLTHADNQTVLMLPSRINKGDTVTLSYTGTTLRDLSGNQVATFSDQSVVNITTNPAAEVRIGG